MSEHDQINRFRYLIAQKRKQIKFLADQIKDTSHHSAPQLTILRRNKNRLHNELKELERQFDFINPTNK